MSDDDVEEFGINDRDLQAAFNPTRRRGRQSKEEAIYGMWATAAERANTRPSSSASPSYYVGRGSQGIAFVSGGIKSGSKIEKSKPKEKSSTIGSKKGTKKKPILLEDYDSDEDSDEKDDDDDDEIEVIEKRRKRRKQSSDEDEDDNDDDDDEGDGDDNDDGDGDSDEKAEDEQDESNDNDGPQAGDSDEEKPVIQRQPPNIQYPRSTPTYSAPVRDKDFGAFEKHTKGFGMKMLKKMGFKEGHGLGKNLQGRAIPIQVVKRQGKGAVGRYGNEDPNRLPSARNEAEPGEKSSKKDAKPAVPQWKKQPREKVPKQKYSYKTFKDVIEEQSTKFHNKKSSGPGAGQTREKIIDMTGREQRVLSSYDAISTKHLYGSIDAEPIFSLDELTHNLDLVIESCEESMVRAHRRRKFDEDTTVALKYDMTSTEEMLKNEETEMNRLNILISMVNRCEELTDEIRDVSDLFFLRNVFDELKRNYQKEYQKYRLWDLAVPVLHQKLREHLALEWDVLHGDHDHDAHVIDIFRKWRNILEDNTIDLTSDSGVPSKETMDPYHRLIWEVWMPILRKAILQWDPRHPEQLIDCLDRWLSCLPSWIVDNIRDQLIFPLLQREVDAWDPLTDPIPIHSWLHPWLPLMSDRLEPLYQPIRTKLGQALQGWQPSDGSARAVLLPWKPVFQQGTWDAFMNKHIVPKLILLMQQFIIDPRQQILEPWHWFMAWQDMIPLPSLIAILEKSFFPQWHQVLNAWLNTNPDYQEIQRWYSGWRSLLPANVVGHTVIKEKLTEGLMMIDRRLSSPSINPSVTSIPAPPISHTPTVNPQYEALHNRGLATSSISVVSSFKDLVANKASENNLLFHPIPNRFFEGKQVYRFGKANIYIDKNVLFIFENGHWMPLRLTDLVSKAI